MLTPRDLLILVWNVRGLNSPVRRDLVREFVSDTGAVLVALFETKLSSVISIDVMAILGPRVDGFEYVPALGTRGRTLVAWQSNCSVDARTRHEKSSASIAVSNTRRRRRVIENAIRKTVRRTF